MAIASQEHVQEMRHTISDLGVLLDRENAERGGGFDADALAPRPDLELRVASLGLFPYEEWCLKHFPAELHPHCGKGIGLWQYPNQLVPALQALCCFQVESYLEIGVAAGGTFTLISELLNQWCRPGRFRAVACDPAPLGCISYALDARYQAGFRNWLDTAPYARYVQLFSEHFEKRWPEEDPPHFDCVLVDGDHSFEGSWADFLMALRLGAGIIIFHDVVNQDCPGVVEAWQKAQVHLGDAFHYVEFTRQYEAVRQSLDMDLLGIGMCIRKTMPLRCT